MLVLKRLTGIFMGIGLEFTTSSEIPSIPCHGIIPFNILIIQFEFLTQKNACFRRRFLKDILSDSSVVPNNFTGEDDLVEYRSTFDSLNTTKGNAVTCST